jgi:hypothetical protein
MNVDRDVVSVAGAKTLDRECKLTRLKTTDLPQKQLRIFYYIHFLFDFLPIIAWYTFLPFEKKYI